MKRGKVKKKIGGFFEIEVVEQNSELVIKSVLKNWTSDQNFGLFSTARSIILSLKKELGSQNIWIPELYCDVFKEVREVKHYLLSKGRFDPDVQFLSENVKENDIVLVVDYFGTEVSQEFIDFAKQQTSVHWVEDAAHNLMPLKNWADFTLFSPRKLVGVSDGGILVQNNVTKQKINFSNWTIDSINSPQSIAPFLRLVAPEFKNLHDIYRIEELNLGNELRSMSEFTHWQLNYMKLDEKVSQRRENFLTLQQEFDQLLPTGLCFTPETVPFGFPIYTKNRNEIQRKLAQEDIFAPIHWQSGGNMRTARQALHEASTLTIPCDHRYFAEDMENIKHNLMKFLA